ncbi:condensin-2 complex subunit H2 [Bombina bombina]|uniref:condensin-2 complex subunit H2 n=1 Tax=Bombina bombina TaxID=8345 RepID=UPI00235A7FC3|nr:condensin-2 complex subunit H2 [Bombina bombina]XP_053572286.1 condensin-2 complex subunit H2 [Bombina bombina]
MEDTESRFTHLLQPIRDLTKNWEVDVAAQLGEYLEELDQICISFDGGKTTMNFAEAALLIQGSACIYSKKVEYLYSLVYQALDYISNKKRDKQPTSVGADGVDNDATFAHRNEEEEFLSLDDITDPKKASVDMKKDQNPNVVNIVPLTPMALVPPEEIEKKNNPLYSRKGEVLASRKDFRMNTCTPHASGAFMLELAGMSPTRFLQQIPPQREVIREPGDENVQLGDNLNMEAETSDCVAPVPVLNFSDADPAVENVDCGGFVPLDDLHEADDGDMEPAEHIERQKMQMEEKGYALRQRVPEQKLSVSIKNDVPDPWRSLDPFDSCEEKPFKKGKHFTVPRGVVDDASSNKRKRKLSCKLPDFMKWFSSTSLDGAEGMKSRRKGPTFADMEVLYWKHVKERMAAQRQLQRRMGAQFVSVVEFPEEEELLNPIEEQRDADYLDHDGAVDDLSDHEDLGANIPACLREEPLIGDLESADLPGQLSYEELVRRNVELFIANSQKYAQETVLSLRVREWEDKMGPQLQEQEERGAFDIHDYGDSLVSKFSRVGEWRTFASLMADKQPYEVCRYMLASLQLANDYTVEVSQKPGLHEGVDTMALRLLSQQKAHERFKTYTAPSISQQ